MKIWRFLLGLGILAAPFQGASQAPSPSASEILSNVRQATGADALNQFSECYTEGKITFAGKGGTIVFSENLRNGANASSASIPELGVHQGHGVSPRGNWQKSDDGFISLTPGGDAWQVDDLYLTRRAYFQPNFGGASVQVLEPAVETKATFDRLEFQVPGGHGFTLWVNRANHFIERVATDASVKYLSDYRPVQGVMLPFSERSGAGDDGLILQANSRTLLKTVREEDFAIPYQKDYELPASGTATVPAESGIIFQAKLNGKGPYTMFFDTGSVNVVSEGVAKELGLPVDNGKGQKWVMSGGTVDTQMTSVKTLQIGALILHDQPFHVIAFPESNGPTPVAVIGYEVLRRLAVKVDYERQQLTFYNAPTFHYSGSGTRIPLATDGTTLEISADVDGAQGMFAVDTGNEVGFLLNPSFVEQNSLIQRLDAHYHGYSGRDYAGPSPEAYFARAKTLAMGAAEVHDVIAYLSTGEPVPGELAGNIGRTVLRRFNVTFDLMRNAMYLEKNANWGKPEVFNRAGIVFDPAPEGEKVMTVLTGSPAESAGIAVGDVITSINGRAPGDDLSEPAYLQPEGTRVTLKVQHGQKLREVQVTLRDLL